MRKQRSPVVMIHGAFSGGWAFERWREPFEEQGYAVHAPTLRFHDNADPPEELGRTSVLDYAADLEALIERLGAPAILIGHSMGGLIAQILAARGRAAALVLLAPSAPWGMLPSTPFEVISSQALYLVGDFWRKVLRPEPWIASSHALDRLDPDMREQVLDRLVPESGLAMFEIFHWFFDLSRATQVDARAVTCPILCFSGSADCINPPDTVRRIAKRYRGRVQYRELEGVSHWPMAEPGWEKIVRHTLFWLDRVDAGRNAAVKD